MTGKALYRRILIMVLIVSLIYSGYFVYSRYDEIIPDKICVFSDESQELNLNLPVGVSVSESEVVETSKNSGDYNLKCRLLGLFDFKNIDVHVIDRCEVIPCGFQIGVYLSAKGILVVDVVEVYGQDGLIYEPSLGKLREGDYIVSVNNVPVTSKEQFIFLVEKYGKEPVDLSIIRNGKLVEMTVTPVLDKEYLYRLGIWVKDDLQGIGTLTYVTKNRDFGALGHGISDSDTGILLESDKGKIYTASIWGIKKGVSGSPGGLCGVINYGQENVIGEITSNTQKGIFGTANSKMMKYALKNSYYPIALKQQIKKGTAYICCQIDGEIEKYEVKITDIRMNEKGNKGIVFKVTDDGLISRTNGVVQGMSGSPILQDGRIIGAVTHVLVNDPKKGYGIFIEEMLGH